MSVLLEKPEKRQLLVAKEGEGRLYYRLGLRYAPKDLSLEALERGLTVSRSYEAEPEAGLHQDQEGVWHVKLGSTVRVRVKVSTQSRRYHLALVDPFAAGFEPVNTALATTSALEAELSMRGVYDGGWYEHSSLRDERAEAFTSLLWEGEYTYSYQLRATTAGQYRVPPAKAEELYAPETFGRSSTERFVIEAD
jgi:uncharacterized protein YfaS (alpha-2-macroglobulin family)